MFQKGTQLLSGSPRRPVLPSPLLALPAGSAGARGGSCPGSGAARPAAAPAPGKRGSRLPGGAGHACACGCRAEGEAGSRHLRFDLPQPFSAAGVGAAGGGRAGGEGARCPLPPRVWSRSPPLPRREAGEDAACPGRAAGRELRDLPRPRGCADGERPPAGSGTEGPVGAGGRARGRSPAPAGSTCAVGKATFPPRPFPGGNQSSLLFSMSLRSLPFVPRYLSLPGIRAAPRWLGEGRAVAKISHLKTTIEPFRPARVVPELYFRAGGKGIVCFAFVFTAKLEGKLQEGCEEPRPFFIAPKVPGRATRPKAGASAGMPTAPGEPAQTARLREDQSAAALLSLSSE